MVQCNFCQSTNKNNYIYAECTHFICTECASAIWDKKYSFKCCNKMTFLQEQTCHTLQRMNCKEQQVRKVECKQNYTPDITQSNSINIIRDQPALKNRQAQQSIYISQFQQASPKKTANDKSQDCQLNEMQSIMGQKIYKVKMTFQAYKQDLQRREQILLKQIYDTYSNHLGTLKNTVTEQDTTTLKHKIDRIIAEQALKDTKYAQNKADKILTKLQYNQSKMKQKLSRHYELLK